MIGRASDSLDTYTPTSLQVPASSMTAEQRIHGGRGSAPAEAKDVAATFTVGQPTRTVADITLQTPHSSAFPSRGSALTRREVTCQISIASITPSQGHFHQDRLARVRQACDLNRSLVNGQQFTPVTASAGCGRARVRPTHEPNAGASSGGRQAFPASAGEQQAIPGCVATVEAQ